MGNNLPGTKRNIFLLIASIIFTLSLVRLFESIIKRELRSEWRNLRQEVLSLSLRNESLDLSTQKKEMEKRLLSLQREVAERKEPYLRIQRRTGIAQLRFGDKGLREMRYKIKGRRAIKGEVILPSGVLQVKEKQKGTAFYIPDWVYELQGEEPPQDALANRRWIKDAFGKYIISLGADIVLSGKVKEECLDLLDLIHLEFEEEDLEAIYNTLKENSVVIFF